MLWIPNLNDVVHPNKLYILTYSCYLQQSLGYQKTSIPIKHYSFSFRYKLTKHLPMSRLPRLQMRFQEVQSLIPHALRVKHKTFLEHILPKNERLLARCLEHLAENRWQKSPSLGISLCFYIP